MLVNGDLKVLGFLKDASFEPLDKYPTKPKAGTAAFIKKRFMLCVTIENDIPFWIPLTQELNTYVHSQSLVETIWIVNHNINFSTPIVQVYDSTGNVIQPESIEPVDQDTIKIVFTDACRGRAILMFGTYEGLPRGDVAYAIAFANLDSITVAHNLGYRPSITVVSDGAEVQPKSIEHTSLSETVITFASPISGEVRCV